MTLLRARCLLLPTILVVFFGACVVHGWKAGPNLTPWKKYGVVKSHVSLRVPRGGAEHQSNEDDEGAPTEDQSQSPEEGGETVKPSLDKPETEESHTESESSPVMKAVLVNASPQERKVRHTSDVIVRLMKENSDLKPESIELRELISNRAQSYIEELLEAEEKLPHPKRVLHYVAPKIPAIKHSPDLMLRVQSFKGGTDTGVAACAIGTVARLCEMYDRRKSQDSDMEEEAFVSVGSKIVKDRRFQQLVECVVCGVDLNNGGKSKANDKDNEEEGDPMESRDIEEVLDEEDAIDDGLSLQDACRAAWGIAVLAGFHTDSFSDVATKDILKALSKRCKQLLLARLQLLREGETQRQDNDGTLTLVQRLDLDAEQLAEDAASAVWTFACVKACTGVRSVPLFETCCTILCQDPVDLRERARREKDGVDGSNFDVNDVVDKLERSEIDVVSGDAAKANETSFSATNATVTNDQESFVATKDGLLDWLTPNEVTDVLWALALHGSTVDTDSKEEIALSETAAAFREIAFDRLVGWLRRDLKIINEAEGGDTNSSAVSNTDVESVIGAPQGDIMVEVVDAAALLSSSATMETEVAEVADIRVEDDLEAVDAHQVQVVDAATLLACSPELPMEKDTEILVASTLARSYESLSEPFESNDADEAADESYDVQVPSIVESIRNTDFTQVSTLMNSGELAFSPHDLCSIAWAVTDLRDPLRYLIVDLITQMVASFGQESLVKLPMADLSNLAWAVARSATQKQALSFVEYSETPAAVVTRWIAESALARLNIDGQICYHDVSLAVRSVLQEFQPPELGRLMWSLACTVSNHMDPFDKKERDASVSQLAELALVAAGTNLSIFSTEDLTRIAWAFLELCDTSVALSQPLVAESLGRILAVIESSLLEWERGPLSKTTSEHSKRADDSLHFSTFFGKSRFPLPLLNQRIHEHEDEDDRQKTNKKKSLPLLRDLPVDPSSLCKLSSAYSRLSHGQRNVVGGWTFVRVAVRLLSSKNGQLMEQCPLVDVIGLCHACAISDVNGRERGQVVRLFAGRVIAFMNQALDPDDETNGKASARLARATPWEVATLLWSVSELGARHYTTDDNRHLAHRKLRLITDRQILTVDEIQSLSAASTLNLLHGITLMDMGSSEPAFVISVLKALEAKVDLLETGQELVDLAQTVAKLRRTVERLEQQSSEEEAPQNSNNSEDFSEEQAKGKDSVSAYKDDPETETEKKEVTVEQNSTVIRNFILESTSQVLTKVAQSAIEKIHVLSAEEMTDLLLVYSLTPFQIDDLVNSIDEEAHRRLEVLGFKGPPESVQDLARRAFESSVLSSNTLSRESESESTVDTIKNGIKAIFGVNEDSDEVSEEDMAVLAALAENSRRTTTLIRETLGRMEQIRRGTGVDTETLLRGVEQGTDIELGRCQEHVAAYRRIDFSTGIQEGRYDGARRRDISKRILSRLFP